MGNLKSTAGFFVSSLRVAMTLHQINLKSLDYRFNSDVTFTQINFASSGNVSQHFKN